eukprot:3890180-Ditylum_brightwellii.AAC.1
MARMRKEWPPPGLYNAQSKNCDFNDFKYLIDEHRSLVAQWMDNALVLLVSTIHHTGKHVLVNRRRPYVTVKNKDHVLQDWGNNFKMEVCIPLLVHHYKAM